VTRLRRIPIALAAVLVVPSALLACGTVVPRIPYLSTAGAFYFPTFAGPFFVAGLIGAALAFLAARLGARRTGVVFAALGILTAAVAGVVIARHASIASANGAQVNIFAALVPRGIDQGAAPDATVTFTRAVNQDLRLDVYRPTTPNGVAPVAIYIHGGGWIRGDRAQQAANLRWLADHGYLVVSPDYVLATEDGATWNTASSQIACALTWITAHATRYGGDANRLFVFGDSSGGALALTTAYAAAAGAATSSCGGTVPAVRAVAAQIPAVDPVTFYENPDPALGGVARRMVRQYLGGNPAEYPERARLVASTTYVTPNAPPTLILLADNDHLVPIEGALQFIDRATQAGVPLHVVRFPWADHGVALQYYSVVNQAWLQLMLRHFGRYGAANGSL
jgi:acetyl esterase/lipase